MLSEVGVDLAGDVIGSGRMALPEHTSFRLPPHGAICLGMRSMAPSFAKRHSRAGFFETTPKPFEIWLPPAVAEHISAALPLTPSVRAASSMQLGEEEGHIVLRRSPTLLSQGLSDWALKISENDQRNLEIKLSAALRTSRADLWQREVINYWSTAGEAPRVEATCNIDVVTRMACFGGYYSLDRTKASLLEPNSKPLALRDALISGDNYVFGRFGSGGVCRLSLGIDHISWHTEACDGLKRLENGLIVDEIRGGRFPVVTAKGIGKAELNALLDISASFEINLRGGILGYLSTGGRPEPEDYGREIRYRSIYLKAQLTARGLELTFFLEATGYGNSPGDQNVEETIIIDWPLLILKRFNVRKHMNIYMAALSSK
jgi:hypothetical protein